MAAKIKICGLRREEDAVYVNRYQPDYAGFILAEPFWRYIPPEQAARLRSLMDPAIQTVGVFVDQPPEHISDLLGRGIIDIAQLHGHEDDAYIDRLKTLTDRPVWKAFKITSGADVERAAASHADSILLDGGTGSGETFDWSLLNSAGRDFFLAGGLGPDNITTALDSVQPYGVDVSSGVESDRVKDEEKIRRFIEAVRGHRDEAIMREIDAQVQLKAGKQASG